MRCLLSLAALFLAVPASAEPVELFVELTLNGQATGDIIAVEQRDGRLWIDPAALRAKGVTVPGGEAVLDPATLPGATVAYDAAGQRLDIVVPPALLPVRALGMERRERLQAIGDFGAAVNYDVYVQRSGGRSTLSLWSEQRVFGAFGSVSNSGTWRTGFGKDSDYIRFDTRVRHVDETRALAFVAGDVITQALPWTSAIRLGGFQVARTYRVRPDLVTYPLPSFAGQAAVPSSVDLFIDGYRARSEAVQPGRYVLNDMPVINGAGQATIVTTDISGRQVATTIPFYVASELLRSGYTDFAVEGGFVRRGYGQRNWGYGAAAGSATFRRGISDRFTIEGHAEASRGLALGGVGAVWSPGLWGVFSASVMQSRAQGASGRQISLEYNYSSRRFSFGWQHVERSKDYGDLASFDLARSSGATRSDRIVAAFATRGHGNFGIGYIDGATRNTPRTQLVSLSYSKPILGRANMFISADRDLRRGGTSAQLRLLIPLGADSAGVGVSRDPSRGMLFQADYSSTVPTDGGFGGNVSFAQGGDGRRFGQANGVLRSPEAQFQVGASFAGGREALWGGASGAVVAMDGGIFASNHINDAFAIVSTGAAGVAVDFENQRLGITNRKGHLLVPWVTSYHSARYAIDPLALADDLIATRVEMRMAVREGGGAVIRMPVREARAVTLALVDGKGMALDPGGRARRAGRRDAMIGWDGIVYLEDVATETALEVTRRDGGRCTARFALPANTPPLGDLGAVPCL